MDAPSLVETERRGAIAVVRLNRPDKRNAVSDALLAALRHAFESQPQDVRVIVLCGAGEHFCAGLDLAEHRDRSAFEVAQHSRGWHAVADLIQFGGRPVVAALHGAVIGGGLEIATAAHVRVAERGAFYQLPEGRRGIFVGGGASARVARIVGEGRMVEMMLTGRIYGDEDGQRLGLSHYLVERGAGLAQALTLAETIAGNAPLSNYMILQALPRIADMALGDGLFVESLAAALTQTDPDARKGIEAFLQKRAAKFGD